MKTDYWKLKNMLPLKHILPLPSKAIEPYIFESFLMEHSVGRCFLIRFVRLLLTSFEWHKFLLHSICKQRFSWHKNWPEMGCPPFSETSSDQTAWRPLFLRHLHPIHLLFWHHYVRMKFILLRQSAATTDTWNILLNAQKIATSIFITFSF